MQQRLIGAFVARDAVGERRQGLFDGHDARRLAARDGQGQQGHHAVGLDLEQALHQAPGRARLKPATTQHQEAREAVGVDAEIGVDLGIAIGGLGAHHQVVLEVA